MTDNQKRAHDIATTLLPKSLELTSSKLYTWDEFDVASINSEEIVDAYLELYDAILDELSSR